jgi:hypothetical protein
VVIYDSLLLGYFEPWVIKYLVNFRSTIRLLTKYLLQQVLSFLRNVVKLWLSQVYFPVHYVSEDLCGVVSPKRHEAREHDMQDNSQRPHVYFRPVVVIGEDLWSDIVRRAYLRVEVFFTFVLDL